jgi:hypothetical protein
MVLPNTLPLNDPEGLWSLQLALLVQAETLLGSRDPEKRIYQPQFTAGGPRIRNTPSLDGAFIELSPNGRCYWPTVVFEMAHETVHLLDPMPGNTNNFEEGVAVAFSLEVQPSYGIDVPVTMSSYSYVLDLVLRLGDDPLRAGKRARQVMGSLHSATARQLADLFPTVEITVLEELVAEFVRGTS